MVGAQGRTGGAVGDAGRNGKAAPPAADATRKDRCVGSVHGPEIGNLGGNDVIEDAEAKVNHGSRLDLVSKGDAGLPHEEWCGEKQSAHPCLYGLVERLVDAMRKIEERSGRARE